MDFARYQELLELGWQIGGSVWDVQIANAKHEYHALRASARDGSGLCSCEMVSKLTVRIQHSHVALQHQSYACLIACRHLCTVRSASR